jgi:hypothetical protein
VVIALVAAAAMILGALSVGVAVIVYKQMPGAWGGQAAPANPFTSSGITDRHTAGGASAQVAGVETTALARPASADKVPAPIAALPPASGAGPRPAIPPAVAGLPLAVHVAGAPLTQSIVDAVKPAVLPLLPPPVRQVVNTVTGLLPAKIDTGLVTITLPALGR